MMNPTRKNVKSDRQGRGVGTFASLILLLVVGIGLTAVQPAWAASETQTAGATSGTGWTNLTWQVLDSASGSQTTAPSNTNKATL